jgi:4'-phosphopantetheinyl transferase EntD
MKALKEASEFLEKCGVAFTATDQLKPLTTLSQEERDYIKGATLSRQKEFSTSRWCARKSLKKLDINSGLILTGKSREPVWPQGTVGSITHAKGLYCAVVGRESDYLSLGIDIEPAKRRIADKTFAVIANNDEIEWTDSTGRNKDLLKLMIFSAKECFFKLLFPLVKMNFSFDAASIFLSSSSPSNNFSVRLEKNLCDQFLKGYSHKGYYFLDDDWLLTFLYLKND